MPTSQGTGLLLGDDPHRVHDAGNVAQDGQQDIDPENACPGPPVKKHLMAVTESQPEFAKGPFSSLLVARITVISLKDSSVITFNHTGPPQMGP